MLLDGAAAERLRPHLERLKGEPDRDFQERAAALGSTVVLWRLPRGIDLVDLVTWLRRRASRQDDEPIGVGVNAVWRGAPRYQGGPGGPPTPAKPLDLSSEGKSAWDPDRDADVATLDTGWPPGFPAALQAQLVPDIDDEEEVDANSDGQLDTQNGHGSFVAGVVHQFSPDLVIDPGKVLTPPGSATTPASPSSCWRRSRPSSTSRSADTPRTTDLRSAWPTRYASCAAVPSWSRLPGTTVRSAVLAGRVQRCARRCRLRLEGGSHEARAVQQLRALGRPLCARCRRREHLRALPRAADVRRLGEVERDLVRQPVRRRDRAHLVRNGVPRLEAVARVLEACVDVPALSVYGPVLTPEAAGKLA